jgi:endonuclease/exonuclease/phosphatase family metal-dependent hydrolase
MADSIKILTLNLFLRPPGIHTNKSDYKDLRVLYFLKHFSKEYDIICLQEVFSTLNRRRRHIKQVGKSQGFLYTHEGPNCKIILGELTDGGLLILSKFPILETDTIKYQKSKGPDSLSSKGAIYAKIEIDKKIVHVFTTHLQASYNTDNYDQFIQYRAVRRHQLSQFKDFVDDKTLFRKELVVIAGDFNIDGRETLKSPLFNVILM